VPAHDVEQLTAALEQLLLQPALRRRMGRAGRQHVEARFDVATTCARLDALYAEMRP